MKSRPSKDEQKKLTDLAYQVFPNIIKYVTQEVYIKMPFLEAFYVAQFCNVFQSIAPDGCGVGKIEICFLFSLSWSFGALLERSDRVKFDEHLRNPELFGRLYMPPPVANGKNVTLFDFKLDKVNGKCSSKLSCCIRQREQEEMSYMASDLFFFFDKLLRLFLECWEYWGQSVPTYDYPNHGPVDFERVLVPNQDNVVIEYLVKNVSKLGQSVLLFGEPGTAKTAIINKYIHSFNEDMNIARNCNFSSATTPFSFQVSCGQLFTP